MPKKGIFHVLPLPVQEAPQVLQRYSRVYSYNSPYKKALRQNEKHLYVFRMTIDHIAIFVRDLEKTKDFYVKHFNAIPNNKYRNSKTLLETYFLSFDSGARIEIMSRPDLSESSKKLLRTGLIHLSFKLGSKELVDSKVEQLQSEGYKIINNPRITGDGYYEACISDNEGNLIEIIA